MQSTFLTSVLLEHAQGWASLQEPVSSWLAEFASLHQLTPGFSATNITWFNQDGAGFGIEEVRALQTELSYSSYNNQARALIIAHAHSISLPAQQALLKLLEEPPQHTLLVLLTPYPDQLIPTIHSRTQRHKLAPEPPTAPADETASSGLPPELLQLLAIPDSIAFHHIITWSDTISERADAINYLEQALIYLHQQPPSAHHLKAQQLLIEALGWLRANVGVKLALAELGFRLKQLS